MSLSDALLRVDQDRVPGHEKWAITGGRARLTAFLCIVSLIRSTCPHNHKCKYVKAQLSIGSGHSMSDFTVTLDFSANLWGRESLFQPCGADY